MVRFDDRSAVAKPTVRRSSFSAVRGLQLENAEVWNGMDSGFEGSFASGVIGRIIVIDWRSDITLPAMRRAFDCIVQARRDVGVPLVNVSVVPRHLTDLPAAHGASAESRYRVVDQLCTAIYVVREGNPIARKIWQGSAAMLDLFVQMEIRVVATVEEGFERAARRVDQDPIAALTEARARGLIASAVTMLPAM